mgnify:CR=1 FL=1
MSGKVLSKGSSPIKKYGVKDKDTLEVKLREVLTLTMARRTIYVKTPDGKKVTFKVKPTDPVKELKKKIEEKMKKFGEGMKALAAPLLQGKVGKPIVVPKRSGERGEVRADGALALPLDAGHGPAGRGSGRARRRLRAPRLFL